ncbi:MAG: hypothetical protein GY780_14995 [bacterium]|nr:hypothetical protein [bacterium]
MRNCQHINPLIAPYAAGELSACERDEIALHLQTCPSCLEEFSMEMELLSVLGELPTMTCPASVSRNIMQSIDDDDQRTRDGKFWWLPASALVAAALALVLLLPEATIQPEISPASPYSNGEISVATDEAKYALGQVFRVIKQNQTHALENVLIREIPDAVGESLLLLTKNLQGEA